MRSSVFEVIWFQLLELVFGSTTLAISTILVAYMLGLGVGAFFAGRMADRFGRRTIEVLAEAIDDFRTVHLHPSRNDPDTIGPAYRARVILWGHGRVPRKNTPPPGIPGGGSPLPSPTFEHVRLRPHPL